MAERNFTLICRLCIFRKIWALNGFGAIFCLLPGISKILEQRQLLFPIHSTIKLYRLQDLHYFFSAGWWPLAFCIAEWGYSLQGFSNGSGQSNELFSKIEPSLLIPNTREPHELPQSHFKTRF